jgi:hypothetical protein
MHCGAQNRYAKKFNKESKVASQFDGYYESEAAFAAYQEYLKTDNQALLNKILKLLSPLVGIVYKISIRNCVEFDPEVIQCDALQKVYFALLGKGLPLESTKKFTSFLHTVIYRSMIDSMRMCKQQTFDYYRAGFNPLSEMYIDGMKDTENKIALTQLRAQIKDLASKDIRFNGNERNACLYMIGCMLGYVNADPSSAQFRYRLTKVGTQKLLQHANILMKSIVYTIKEVHETT